jgi:hypothetical protein
MHFVLVYLLSFVRFRIVCLFVTVIWLINGVLCSIADVLGRMQ